MAIRVLGKVEGTLLVGPAFCTSEHTEPLLSELVGGAVVARRGCWSPARVSELQWRMQRRGWRTMRKTSRSCSWFEGWVGELHLRILRRETSKR